MRSWRPRGVGAAAGTAALLLVVAVAVSLHPRGSGAEAASPTSPITLLATRSLDLRLQELTLTTPALATATHVRVLLPSGYDPAAGRRYPVLYLLHGGFGSDVDWTTAGGVEPLTAGLGLIVVMPDGGQGGWYGNWDQFGTGQPPEWETYHIDQLIPWIDQHYDTVANRSGRAIAGLSMGGFGAMSYAARHPDLFVSASSFSGAVDMRNLGARGLVVISPLIDKGAPGAIYGLPALDGASLQAHNPWDLAANLRGLHVALYTGNGLPGPLDGPNAAPVDPLEFDVHDMNQSFDARLRSLGIAHTYDDYGNGTHSWGYWHRDLRQELPAIMATFASPPPPPATVDYRSFETSYSVFGWQVDLHRPGLEASDLRDATSGGFTLSGSGSAAVTTPTSFVPDADYRTVVAGAPTCGRADATGRLHLTIDLGPSTAVLSNLLSDLLPQLGLTAPPRAVTVTIAGSPGGCTAP